MDELNMEDDSISDIPEPEIKKEKEVGLSNEKRENKRLTPIAKDDKVESMKGNAVADIEEGD
eukprot:14219443-Ditylum_brightwellii.AAC.1